eukprot:scpid70943/ scgid21952/ Probable ergosterol biosynthetic protein 28 &gt; Probable ergosterol biosynthetic protein 28
MPTAEVYPAMKLPMRIWIAVTGVMANVQAVQCFFGSPTFLAERIYTQQPEQVTPLTARLFGAWILLAGGLRLGCAYNIHNKHLYNATLYSYILAFGHFSTELAVYKTADVNFGTVAPLLVSGFSILWMLIGLRSFQKSQSKTS